MRKRCHSTFACPAAFTPWSNISKSNKWNRSTAISKVLGKCGASFCAPSVSVNKNGLSFTNFDWKMSRTSKVCVYEFDMSCFPLLILIKASPLYDALLVLVISHIP